MIDEYFMLDFLAFNFENAGKGPPVVKGNPSIPPSGKDFRARAQR